MRGQQCRCTCAALAGVALVGALLLKLTSGWWSGWLPGCPIRRFTGWFCAGCGGTRALLALLEGDPGRALRMNPALVVLGLFGLGLWVRAAWREWVGRRPLLPVVGARWVWLGGLLLLAFGVLRNLPQWPWCWLAPG